MAETKKEDIISFKLLLLGDSTVGKTAFILRFCDDKFDEDSLTTIGLDQKNKFVKRGDKRIELHIWDTAGQERFRAIAKNLYKGADGIILMYDISNNNSFQNIKRWITSIKESVDITKIALIIVGNKCDLPTEERVVDEDSRQNLENQCNIKIFEASAKDNINVNESFIALIDKMLGLGLGKKRTNEFDDDGQKLKNSDGENRNNCCGGNRKRKSIQ